MSWVDVLPFVLLLGGGGLALRAYRDRRSSPAVEVVLTRFFEFFGIHDVDCRLAAAVFLATGAVGGAALDFIAHNHLGPAYPWWYGVVTAVTGLGVGLVSARAVAVLADADDTAEDHESMGESRDDAAGGGGDIGRGSAEPGPGSGSPARGSGDPG